MQPKLSIVIVNYNGGDLVVPCIASIYENPPECAFEIIFIDNASIDDSAEKVAEQFDQVILSRNGENIGLAKAFNAGVTMAKGDYLLSLDNDTRVLPGALSAMVSHLDAVPEVGAVGSRLLNTDMTPQKTARRAPSALNALFGRRSYLTRLFPNNAISRRYLMDEHIDATRPYAVDWLSTAALMVRKQAIDKVGALDEDFFVYWVDADWCARIRGGGWQIHVIPESLIIHDENLSGQRRSRRSTRMIIDFHRGAYLYYRKNHLGFIFNPMILVAIIGLALRASILIAWGYLRELRNLKWCKPV